MRDAALKILFVFTLLLLGYNYWADLTSGISAYYSEGPTLDMAMRLVHGQSMYPGDIQTPPYTMNLYGPLYALLQWPFLAVTGPTHLFGNMISLVSHLTSAWFAGLIVRHLTKNTYASAVTSLLVLAMPLVGGFLPLYRVDLLAQALSMAGIYIGITSTNRKGDALVALLFAAAAYTKLTYLLCGPATVFFYHFLQNRRTQALVQSIFLVAITTLFFGIIQWLSGGGFYLNILTGNQINYSLARALDNWATIYPQLFIASLAIPALWLNKNLPPPARFFAALYLFFAACSAMAAGKVGANYGYFSELELALTIVLGVNAAPRNWLIWGQLATCLYFIATSPYYHYIRTNHAEIAALKEKISREPGLVLADDYVGLVVLAGKPLYFEATQMTQLYYKGQWSQDHFVQELRDGKFSMLLLGEYHLRQERWTPEMIAAIRERYEPSGKSRLVEIWRPKP